MKKTNTLVSVLSFVIAILVSSNLNSAAGAPCGNYLSEDGLTKGECEEAYIDASDKASLQRGAQIYMNYCLGCHSLKYLSCLHRCSFDEVRVVFQILLYSG